MKPDIKTFQKTIWDYFKQNKRNFPWRETTDPYHIFISEVMLQQTQTYRVEPKYREFIKHFPNFGALATAPFVDVLRIWQGLGYNRRAKFLHQSAQIIIRDFSGVLPDSIEALQKLPGIGFATACSIVAFAFNKPSVFIETNIRSVFIHFFFQNNKNVYDRDIIPLVKKTLNHKNPRKWYWALMDYGAHLKSTYPNPSRKSKHHTKQSRFEESHRQLRGKLLKHLLGHPQTKRQLINELKINTQQIEKALNELCNEGFIVQEKRFYRIT